MLILDSSAVLAVLLCETEAEEFLSAIQNNECAISSATNVELSTVADSKDGGQLSGILDRFLQESMTAVINFDFAQASIARHCYRQYGKNSGSKARLNFGDTFSYALATFRKAPLLFKGEDFAQTDVQIYQREK